MARVEFRKFGVGDASASGILESLSVFCEFQPKQPAALGALEFALALRNESARDIEILNPYDLLTYVLTNEEGWPISLAAPPSRIKTSRQTPFVNLKAEYLKIKEVAVNDIPLDSDAEIEKEMVTIPSGSTYQYALQIDKVVPPETQTHASQAGGTQTTISSGRYSIVFLLPLISITGGQKHSRLLQSDKITISVE